MINPAVRIGGLALLLPVMASAAVKVKDSAPRRSLQVELTGQEQNAIKTSWPGIGCWFWSAEEFQPEGYKRFLDLHEKHSAFRLLTTSIRHPVEVTDPKVHDQIKAAAAYARRHDMALVMDLDVRLARGAFQHQYPGEMQEIVRLRETTLNGTGEVSLAVEPLNLGDHYTFRARGYDAISARVLRIYSYMAGGQGIEPGSVDDITARCRIVQADAQGVKVTIPCRAEEQGRTACVLAAVTLFTPDVFAPHLIEFERGILDQYADVPLAGACKDEWGFPGRFGPRTDDVYFSPAMARVYARRRPGRDLLRDMLLMVKGGQKREEDRAAAINHYMEMNWQRNGDIETAFYVSTKKVFGPAAMSGTHPTWYSFPSPEEAFKNGLDWWVCRRDLAQTDEATPFAARTALTKKWHSPLWYNMYYYAAVPFYEEDLWRHVLGGGRMNFHPLWPHPWEQLTTSLLAGKLLAADCRVRLLNYISTASLDCPVAVIFGHPAALNWSGPGFGDMGLAVANGLWAEGYYADLIPSSEIGAGALKRASDGRLQYGRQRYAAAVFYHPQYERPATAKFFRKMGGREPTALFRVGEWTRDFEGRPFDGDAALPKEMKTEDEAGAVRAVIAQLKAGGLEPQTPGTLRGGPYFSASMMPKPSGQCRLLDGTVIMASGEKDVMGDPIQKIIKVDGRDVAFDAVGLAAVRLDGKGKLEAMAAGALKSFRGGGLSLELPERGDVALWRDRRGAWHGVLQGWTGPVPAALTAITDNWARLLTPEPFTK